MPKLHHIINSFNAGELSPLMQARTDQEKYVFGCRTMENFIPLIYGGAERRPGLEYIAGCKSNSAASRLIAFEHSIDDTYILEFANQVIRVYRAGGQVVGGVGTEDLSDLDNIVAHWLLNDDLGTTVLDDDGATHNGTATVDTDTIHEDGKVGTGCFDLDGQYAVAMIDDDDFSFDDSGSNPFSIACWAYVTQQGDIQNLLSKWKEATAREWRFSLNNERKLQLHLSDDSISIAGGVSHYKLNESAANTTVTDAIGLQNGAATQDTNTAGFSVTGIVSNCYDFGGDQAVEINDNAAYSFGDGSDDSAFSISAWIYVTAHTAVQNIVTKYDHNVAVEWKFELTSFEVLRLYLLDDSAGGYKKGYTDSALSTGWHHIVVTYSGNESGTGITFYVDGSPVSSGAGAWGAYTAMENTATKVVIGASYTNGSLVNYFQDKIDNVIIFNVELTAANAASLWNSGNGTETLSATFPSAISDDALGIGWHFLCATYDSTGGATAANGIILYVDGAAVTSTKTNEASYVAMENTATTPKIGCQESAAAANEKFWGDKIDEVSIFSDVLTPTEVASLYSTTALEITSPYLTADLPYLKIVQSADVMYITHPNYEPRKLSRTGHTVWTLEATDFRTGPWRNENETLSKTITASATTGSVTLTATGHTPFVTGTTVGHEPSGSANTSKSQTGALFKLVHATGTSNAVGALDTSSVNDTHTALAVPKGITWDFTTNGTWGTAANAASVVLERSYDSFTTKETIVTVTSAANKNITTSGTEEFADATYRARVSEAGGDASICSTQLSVRDSSHVGIVEITSVASPTSAVATVLTTLGSTDLTHRWSESSWSNYRGWPITVEISPEERLTFGGNAKEPLNIWGTKVGDYTNMTPGTSDDDAINFTLVGSGKQNRIRWLVPKSATMVGTVGGEHLLGASDDKEALTPTNVQAKPQTSHGSEDIQALLVNQSILFVQRGGRKIRELIYDFDSDSHKADDLTVFANHITESGIVDMDYQRTPDPMLWCVRDDGELAVMSYERDQKVFAWSRIVTTDSTSDSDFESVAIMYGGAGEEDEVWVTVRRTIGGSDVRYIERFKPRDWGSDDEDAFFVDSGLTYDSTSTTTITGLGHLEGESVAIYADGEKQDNKTVSGGAITLDTAASKVQVGLPYTSTLKPMKLDLANLGLATTKKIIRGVISLYKTKRGEWGYSTSTMNPFVFRKAGQTSAEFPVFTGDIPMPFRAGYEKSGDVIVRQTDPLPMTILALTLDVGVADD